MLSQEKDTVLQDYIFVAKGYPEGGQEEGCGKDEVMSIKEFRELCVLVFGFGYSTASFVSEFNDPFCQYHPLDLPGTILNLKRRFLIYSQFLLISKTNNMAQHSRITSGTCKDILSEVGNMYSSLSD